MHLAVLAQSAMLLLPRFELADVAKAIKKHKPTIFCAVPSLYNAVNRYRKLTREDLSSIRLCVSGGAPLPAEVQERFEALTGGQIGGGLRFNRDQSGGPGQSHPRASKKRNHWGACIRYRC